MEDKLLDALEKQAKEISTIKTHIPMALIVNEGGGLNIVGMMFSTPEEKIDMIKSLRKLVEEANATRYYFICEGWNATAEQVLAQRKQPSKIKGKGEVLIIMRCDKTEGTFERIIPINRKDGKVIFGEYLTNDYIEGYAAFNVWHPNQVVMEKENE